MTNPIRCLAVDDEPLALNIVREFCQRVPFLDLVAEAPNAITASDIIRGGEIDLVFLDINMPHLSGVDLVRMTSNMPMVIFTTAYSDFALTGFDLNAVDYLLKPFSFDRFFKAVVKAKEFHEMRSGAKNAAPSDPAYLMVRVDYSTIKINTEEILFVEGLKDYVKIFTLNKTYVTKSTLKNVEERLSTQHYLRVHKSFIVNVSKIEAFENNQIVIGNHKIPLGAQNKDQFLEYIERNKL